MNYYVNLRTGLPRITRRAPPSTAGQNALDALPSVRDGHAEFERNRCSALCTVYIKYIAVHGICQHESIGIILTFFYGFQNLFFS